MPAVVAWEVARECNLACRFCKADAGGTGRSKRSRRELTTDEACTFVDELSTFRPLLILTGGEPLLRKDVDIVIERAATSGVRTALATNGTLVNEKRARRLRDAGLTAASISIDGADAQSHDSLRGVSGAYRDALNGAKALKEAGITFQINTTVTNANVASLSRIHDVVRQSGASAWHVFALVPTGRGCVTDLVSKSDYYRTLKWLDERDRNEALPIRPTCTPQYRLEEGRKGCLAGLSYVFVTSSGTVQPCGYLPVPAGDIKRTSFSEIWETSPLLASLRDPSAFTGACKTCRYSDTCRGCRARAQAMSGDYLGDDPYCGGVWT
ncbi:MAG TPA: radical SAM protein [Candidatus Bathyarchaeia archaeon]|nr:radical SAM protein [Candidatus Bathyarchaeia archaeon]